MANPPSSDVLQSLERLQRLMHDGVLTRDEFEAAKRAALAGAGKSPRKAEEIGLHFLKEAATHVVLGLLGIDALVSWVGNMVMAGTSYLGVFLYVVPLSLAVAATIYTGLLSENWLVTLIFAAAALSLSMALQNLLPGARHIIPVNPTCHALVLTFLRHREQTCLINPGPDIIGGCWYVVTVLYGYAKVYGAGLVVASVAAGSALPFVVGVAADSRKLAESSVSTG